MAKPKLSFEKNCCSLMMSKLALDARLPYSLVFVSGRGWRENLLKFAQRRGRASQSSVNRTSLVIGAGEWIGNYLPALTSQVTN